MTHPVVRVAVGTDLDAVRACVRAAYAVYVERMDREPAPMTPDYARLIAGDLVRMVWTIPLAASLACS